MNIKPVGNPASETVTGVSTGRLKTGHDLRIARTFSERATLSADTTAVESLVAKAMRTSGIRTDKVESIKTSILDGSYRVDAAQTAMAILVDQA